MSPPCWGALPASLSAAVDNVQTAPVRMPAFYVNATRLGALNFASSNKQVLTRMETIFLYEDAGLNQSHLIGEYALQE